jgi:parvulin-like peptidyl-prolyl isomerase
MVKVWKRIQLPKISLPRIAWRRPSRDMTKKMVLAGLLAAALVGAFYWGRLGGMNAARAQTPQPSGLHSQQLIPTSQGQFGRHVVAYIYGNMPITREELGEYLIDRFGAERIEFLVNRRIIEMACQAKNIRITDAEINAQLGEDLKSFKTTEREFVNSILRRYNKTLFEWKEDVIRPKLALQRYVQGNIKISEEDIQKGFEAKYGDKVECRIIVLSKEQAKDKYDIWTRVSKSPEEFDKVAKSSFIGPLAAEGGKIPPIHHHFADPNIEREAFKLQKGEISPLIGMPDNTTVILQCVQHLPADTTKRLDQERMALNNELTEMRLAQEIPKVFAELRKTANPQIFLKRDFVPPESMPQTMQLPQAPPAQATLHPPAAPEPANNTTDRPMPESPPLH